MEIRFCNDCGKRITEPELLAESGDSARQLCGTCLANAKALQAPVSVPAPISSAKNTAVLSKRSTGQVRPARSTERVGSGLSPATKTPLISAGVAVAISAGILLGVVGFFLLTGSPKEKEKEKDSRSTEKTIAKTEPAPRPAPVVPVAPPVQTAPSPAAPEVPLPGLMRSSEPVAGAAHELTPKEEYELRLKRGEIKPAPAPDTAAAPVAGKEIPVSNEEWKPIFNGKDLEGFHVPHGTWKVIDGVLTAVPSATDFSRIQTNADYADFELKFKLMVVSGHISELQLREYNQVYPLQPENGVWKDVSVKAFGPTVIATMDGVALRLSTDSGNAAQATGPIGFYATKGASIKLKDISLRLLKR